MMALTTLSGPEATLGVAVVGVLATGLNIYFSRGAKSEAKATNKAVNNTDGPTIYSLAFENHRKVGVLVARLEELAVAQDLFERRWDETPWENGAHIRQWVADREAEGKKLREDLKIIVQQCPLCESKILDEIKDRLSAIEKKIESLGD